MITSVRSPTSHDTSTCTVSSVVQPAAVASGIARKPNSTKNEVSSSATKVICSAWLNTVTSPTFSLWRMVSGRSGTGPVRGVSSRAAGVSAINVVDLDPGRRTSRGHASARAPATARTPRRAGRRSPAWPRTARPSSVPATCHTSALMNRNVVNSSSSGNARTTRLASVASWAALRRTAQLMSGDAPRSW